MYYSKIIPFDVANGPGFRVSLFVSGCSRHCKGCFNPEAWNFNHGQEFTKETMLEILRLLDDDKIEGLSILGGDPFEPANIQAVADICYLVKLFRPSKSIWIWTGYDFVTDGFMNLPWMKDIDVIVDGPFVEDLKDLSLPYRGSSNQRIIDVKPSLEHRCAVRYPH